MKRYTDIAGQKISIIKELRIRILQLYNVVRHPLYAYSRREVVNCLRLEYRELGWFKAIIVERLTRGSALRFSTYK